MSEEDRLLEELLKKYSQVFIYKDVDLATWKDKSIKEPRIKVSNLLPEADTPQPAGDDDWFEGKRGE